MKDLALFQERKERVASALSILGSILTPENRPLVLRRLRAHTAPSPADRATEQSVEQSGSWLVPAAVLGSILCGAAGLLFLLDAERPEKASAWGLLAGSAILGVAVFVLLKKAKHAPGRQHHSPGAGDHQPGGAATEIEQLATAFNDTVKPLANELQMTVNLDALDGLHAELKAYEDYGRDLEDFHVTE